MAIVTRSVTYDVAGLEMEGFAAWDDRIDGPRPLVLIFHAFGGRNQYECDRAKALAKLGYLGFAVDLYGVGVRSDDPGRSEQLMRPLLADRSVLQDRMTAALVAARDLHLTDQKKVAAIGYCFGGLCVLDMARMGAAVLGVVSFHGLFEPPDNIKPKSIAAKVLVLHGWDDPMVPPDHVIMLGEELSKASADWRLYAYGNILHAFTNPLADDRIGGVQYDPVADKRSWAAMTDFLVEVFT